MITMLLWFQDSLLSVLARTTNKLNIFIIPVTTLSLQTRRFTSIPTSLENFDPIPLPRARFKTNQLSNAFILPEAFITTTPIIFVP